MTKRLLVPQASPGVLRESLAHDLAAFRRSLRQCRRQPDTVSVHNLRVLSRRLVGWCDNWNSLDPHRDLTRDRRRLQRLRRKLADLRDTQVQLERVHRLPKSARTPPLLRWLEQRQRKAARQVRDLCQVSCRSLTASLRKRAHRRRDPATELHLQAGQQQQLRHLRTQARHCEVALDPNIPTTWHHWRIALKRLRYALESRPEDLPSARELNLLRRLQTRLGAIQDLDVFVQALARRVRRHPGQAGDLAPALDWCERRRDTLIRQAQRQRPTWRRRLLSSAA
ncbi:MAG: CHAD domain-containing protein [Verrucomicrobia bacterium]|nr:CHAD domain-containing protein [Verrucomicrobiota bacterium]